MKRAKATIAFLTALIPLFTVAQTADFNFSTSNGLFCSPQAVTFIQNCTGTPQQFVWNFGNGSSGTAGTQTVLYTVPGTYNVTLTAVYPSGGVSVTKTIIINPTPTISVAVDRNYICQPGIINFTASGSAFITSYEWDFGDGSALVTTGTATTSYSYSAYGNYTVTVRGITAQGCSATATISVRVEKFAIINPTVIPTDGCIPVNALFTAGVNLPVGDAPANFAWDFGDGSPVSNTATGNTSHLYNITTPITTAGVTITSTQGCTNQYVFPRFAYGTPPFNTNAATQDGRSTYCASETITFTGTAVNANSYEWDYGDGIIETTMNTSITHRYRVLGAMQVVLTPIFNGCRGQQAFINITIEGVVADYTFGNSCGAKNVFNYTNISLGNISSFRWNFSDVPTTPDITNYNTSHTFPTVGTHTTQLYVYDAITGCSDSMITNQYTALPVFTSSIPAVCKDSTIVYNVANGYPANSGYSYEFHVAGVVASTGVITSLPVTPTVHGTYNDTLIIISPNANMCADTILLPNPTRVRGPVLDFSLPLAACVKNNQFPLTNNTVPFFAGENIVTWAWDFGDGTTSGLQNPPPHQFLYPANYWVKLKASDVNQCEQIDSILISVMPTPEIAVFPVSDTLCAGQSMNLYAYTADTLLWTTNYNIDCITCDTVLVNPLVTTAYVAQAKNALGCLNTDTSFIRVYGPINLQIMPADTSVCPGQPVQFRSNTIDGIYTWAPPSFLNAINIHNPVSRPDTAISYSIIVADSVGCYADTTTARINVYALPTVDAGPDQVIPFNNAFTISPAYSPDIVSYAWTPAINSLSCTNCAVVNGIAEFSVLYRIEVTNENSCKAFDEVKIVVACNKANLNLPSGFTPNNDGRNDQFYPMTRGYKIINKFIIFDRWGQKVFERYNFAPNSPALGWDGRTKDGQVSSTAAFVWIIEATCDEGQVVTSKGTITVIR